jgi:hypothetical protein
MVSSKVKAGVIIALALLFFVMVEGCATQNNAKAGDTIPDTNLVILSHKNFGLEGDLYVCHDYDNNNTVYVTVGYYGRLSGVSAVPSR